MRWVVAGVVVALVGVGALGYLAFDARRDVQALERTLTDVGSEAEDALSRIDDVAPVVVNIGREISDARTSIEEIERSLGKMEDAFTFGGLVKPQYIDKPFYCFSNDLVFWDYGDGIAC